MTLGGLRMGSDQCHHHSVQNIYFTRGDRLCLRSEHKSIRSEHKSIRSEHKSLRHPRKISLVKGVH